MKRFQTISLSEGQEILTIWLNRPEVHNAFDQAMLLELTQCFRAQPPGAARAVVLRGRGRSFCAGADLHWMRAAAASPAEQNYQDALLLAECFRAIRDCAIPTLAVVHGNALGGGVGLAAACDLAFCADEAVFGLSEVKLGLVPAVISPYILRRTGEFGARALMLTGRRILGPEAERLGLVNSSRPAAALEETVSRTLDELRSSAPEAMHQVKRLIAELGRGTGLDAALEPTARLIAEVRASAEGREGMAAFLEKRLPAWVRR